MKTFILVWFSQIVSLIGSSLTGFALGVWVYQTTGSVTQFALIMLFETLPLVLISPLAGTLVDRWSRRRVMILSDTGSGLCTLAIAILVATGNLELWHIYLTAAINSSLSAFQWPAFSAATTLMVPNDQLGRASGMTQFGESSAQLIAPVLAGFLLLSIGLRGIILIDFVTFGFALITLLCVRFSEPSPQSKEGMEESQSLWHELVYGFTYITANPGLLGLLVFCTVMNLIFGFLTVLFQPFVLSFFSPVTLGFVESVGGLGMLVGSAFIIIWSDPQYRMPTMFITGIVKAVSAIAISLQHSLLFLSLSSFVFFATDSIGRATVQVIWQSKVKPEVQGRVFAFRRMIARASFPLAALLAGPLNENVFEPLMASDGFLAPSLGSFIGVGQGHGIALFYIVLASSLIFTTLIAYLYPPLRLLEDELPDAIPSASASLQ